MKSKAPLDFRGLLREARFIDWFACFYYPTLALVAHLGTGVQTGRQLCITVSLCLWVWALSGVFVGRSRRFRPSLFTSIYYRLSLALPITCSYLLLKTLLPIVRPDAFDAVLHGIDVWLFGVEPTIWLDSTVTSFRVEWFSFFYYSYFYLITISILGVLLQIDDPRVGLEFGIGTTLCFCLGHLIYMIAPGYGPHSFLAGEFQHALPHGPFYTMVLQTVTQAGAQKDIFPSLHTALPTFITLHAIRHRNSVTAFKWVWPLLGFVTINIIIATVYLRWHYLIDVFAGLGLATTMLGLSAWITRKDLERTERLGLDHPWPQLRGAK